MRVVHRRMQPADRVFVVNSWVRSYRRSLSAGVIDSEHWSAVMVPQIERYLDRPRVHTLVLADPTATDHVADLFGWIAWEHADPLGMPLPLVYYLYVKDAYRGHGFARALMRAAGVDPAKPFYYACQTWAALTLHDAGKLPHARHRPQLARVAERTHDREDREDTRAGEPARGCDVNPCHVDDAPAGADGGPAGPSRSYQRRIVGAGH